MASPESRPLRIVAAVEWYPPAYKAGGPIRSVHNLMSLLRDQTSHRLEVVCGAYDIHSDAVVEGITPNKTHHHDGVAVTYLTRDRWTSRMWRELLKGSQDRPATDILYLNSLFSVPFALTPLRVARSLGVKVVLAPRGMLGAGALAIKPRKKKLFLAVARFAGWFRDVRWHASTEVEAKEVHKYFPDAQVVTALNVPLAPVECQNPEWGTELVWVAVGRIQSKKNLHFALEVLQEVKLKEKKLTVELVGPAEDEAYLKRLLGMERPGLKVVHRGPVPPQELGEVWGRAHALLMPTTHENFGHAVVESWAHGRPVLLSDQTPWRGLAAEGLGWDLPLDRSVWVKAMEEALEWDFASWKKMSGACRARHLSLVQDSALVQANRAVFEG
jgi:glycosyltransferase involved in cell wall biosynthesis